MKNQIKLIVFLIIANCIVLIVNCNAQLMYVARNGTFRLNLIFLNDNLTIVFIDSGCTMNVYNGNLQSNPISKVNNIYFANEDCSYSGINEPIVHNRYV